MLVFLGAPWTTFTHESQNYLHKKNIKTLGLEESDEESSDDDDALSSNLITYDDFKIGRK